MPTRRVPLVTEQLYHLFNRGINKQPIFLGTHDFNRALELLEFYSFTNPPLRFSKFLLLSQDKKIKFWELLKKENKKIVELVCFCVMPNHFHFLLQQVQKNGTSKFMSVFQNSYTRYFNVKYKKIGPILQGQFKAVRVEDDNQFLHLSRYIHLNPYSSFVIKNLSDLENYPWSSLPEYLRKTENQICNKKAVLANFKDALDYKKFVFDQADYQRELEKIKHLVFED